MSLTSKHYDLTKKFRFESAHRLAKGYVGKCANIHGHSWNGELTVRCYELDSMGMGVDFGIMKEAVLRDIEEMFDHKLILQKDDPIAKLLEGSGSAVVLVDRNPTSEVLAELVYNFAKERLNYSINGRVVYEVLSVAIDETCTSSCKYSE